jgi:hypothetical protein
VTVAALILVALFPSAIAAVQGIAVPDGSGSRGVALGLILVVLGFDLADQVFTVRRRAGKRPSERKRR